MERVEITKNVKVFKIFFNDNFRRGVTPTTGYTWLGEESLTQHFPYNNEGHCSSLIVSICFVSVKLWSENYSIVLVCFDLKSYVNSYCFLPASG